jgi:hypothetical protein
MRPTLIAIFFCTIVATPSVAQNYYGPPRAVGAYNGHYDYDRLVPPRPVPAYPAETSYSVVTTRRIVGSAPAYLGNGVPAAVVTTRRVVAPRPILDEDEIQLGPAPLPYPLASPYRRVVNGTSWGGPGYPAQAIVGPSVAPAAPVIVEERRIETIRRIIRPGAGEWLD